MHNSLKQRHWATEDVLGRVFNTAKRTNWHAAILLLGTTVVIWLLLTGSLIADNIVFTYPEGYTPPERLSDFEHGSWEKMNFLFNNVPLEFL